MGAMTELTKPPVSADQLHLGRSECLDAFVEAEEAVVTLLMRSKTKIGCDLLGQKMESLRKAKPSPQYSKAKRTAVLPLLDQLECLLPIRADFVHARLQVVPWEGDARACFVNARHTAGCTLPARLITLDEFAKLTRRVEKLAQELVAP